MVLIGETDNSGLVEKFRATSREIHVFVIVVIP